jgi:hypothetical protein
MSGTNVDITKLEQNWTGLAALGNQAIGNVKLECKAPAPRDLKLYFNFDIECAGKNNGRPCGGHVSLQHGQNPAHLALMGWDGARKTHYWFAFERNGTLKDAKAPAGMSSDIANTSVAISTLPKEIGDPIRRMVQTLYNGCLY